MIGEAWCPGYDQLYRRHARGDQVQASADGGHHEFLRSAEEQLFWLCQARISPNRRFHSPANLFLQFRL